MKVIRYGRHEMNVRSAPADGALDAGDVVLEQDGGDTVTQATSSATTDDRICVAIDDRERGMEAGDEYSDGELVKYVALSGGGVRVLMADGETLDASSEDRLVMSSTDGKVRPWSSDSAGDALFEAETTETIETDGEAVLVPAVPM